MGEFDPADARRLKAGEWLTFPAYPGLRLKRASKQVFGWAYRYRSPIDGRLRQIKLGNWPATPWTKAVTRWDELRHARNDGTDPQLERRRKRTEAREKHAAELVLKKRRRVTVEAVVRFYLEERIPKDCKTQKARDEARRLFERRVFDAIGDKPAHTFDRSDAADFLSTVGLETRMDARALRSRLGAAWDHAIERKRLPTDQVNPWRGLLRGRLAPRPRTRYLDDGELAVFLERVHDLEADVCDALMLTLMLACRSGEIVGMDWKAVDLKRGTWTLHETKTNAPRTVRLPRQAVAILKGRGKGFEIPQRVLSGALREAKSLGLREFTPHDLRRSARTGLARLGVRDEVAEAALGHVEGGVRGIYNLHKHESEVGEALQRWCDHIGALSSPEVKSIAKARSA
jgi:integrase